jgi:hypothetical protein
MPNTYYLLASNTVGSGGVGSVTFSSIPATYTDLVIKGSVRTNNNAVFDNLQVRFNSDSGANYSRLFLSAEGAGTNSFKATGNTAIFASYSLNAANSTASTFSNTEIYIPNYTSSNQKSISLDSVVAPNAATGYLTLFTGLWSGTAAITAIELAPNSGTLFNQYSTFYLYGIKNS